MNQNSLTLFRWMSASIHPGVGPVGKGLVGPKGSEVAPGPRKASISTEKNREESSRWSQFLSLSTSILFYYDVKGESYKKARVDSFWFPIRSLILPCRGFLDHYGMERKKGKIQDWEKKYKATRQNAPEKKVPGLFYYYYFSNILQHFFKIVRFRFVIITSPDIQ